MDKLQKIFGILDINVGKILANIKYSSKKHGMGITWEIHQPL